MTDTRDSFEKAAMAAVEALNWVVSSSNRNGIVLSATDVNSLAEAGRNLYAALTDLQAGAGDGRLTKPARVGCTSFNNGVNERLVIECAQRNYEYWKNPPDIDTEGLAKLFGAHPNTDKRDAARYRWLKKDRKTKDELLAFILIKDVDAAIDNAQATEGK